MIDLTAFISSSRSTLQIADHATYRSTLTRRVQTLRKRLGIATSKKDKFTSKPITPEQIRDNEAFLELALLGVERSWAHAMVLKHEGLARDSAVKGRTRAEVLSKLRKAAKGAEEAVKLVQEVYGQQESVLLEARAYAAGMKGSEMFERLAEVKGAEEQWEVCLKLWSTARVIYAALMQKAEVGEQSDVFRDMLAGTVDPTIRYAAYQARLSRTIAIESVAKKYFPRDDADMVKSVEELDPYALKEKPKAQESDTETKPAGEIPNSVTWRGRKANIVDASIGQALASVAAAEAQLTTYLSSNPSASTRNKAAAYDTILIASQDASDAAKRATDELEKEHVDESDARMQDLRVTSLAVNYALVSWRVGRNRVLIGSSDGLTLPAPSHRPKPKQSGKPPATEPRSRKLARLRERVVLYDSTIQSITSIKDLRGAVRDETFVQELDSQIAYFRAFKCVNIALSHTLLGNHLNALALLQRASDLLPSDKSSMDTTDESRPPTLDLSAASTSGLREHVQSTLARKHALVALRQLESENARKSSQHVAQPVVHDLSAYPVPGVQVDTKNLVNYPVQLQPVPIKPLFLDVGWNYIDYPGRVAESGVSEKMDVDGVEEKAEVKEEKKRGWFGFGR